MRRLLGGLALLALPACCPDVDMLGGDTLLIMGVPQQGAYWLEVVEQDRDNSRWSCGMLDGEPDCTQVQVMQDGSWDVELPAGHLDQDLLVWQDEVLLFQEQMLWTVETGEGCTSDVRGYSSVLDIEGV